MTSRVIFVPFTGQPVPRMGSPLKWKRRAMWDNAARNTLVASVAVGLSRKPRKKFRELGVRWKETELPDRVRVTILVESPEHAEWLSELLPAWEVQHAIPIDYEPNEVEVDPFADPPPGRIATLMYAAMYGIVADVVVRATGGTGKLPREWFTNGRGRLCMLLIVDFRDLSGPREETDSDVRRYEYHEEYIRELKPTLEKRTT